MSRAPTFWRFNRTPDGIIGEKGNRTFLLEWETVRRFLECESEPGTTEPGPDGAMIYFGEQYVAVRPPRYKKLIFPRPLLDDMAREAGII